MYPQILMLNSGGYPIHWANWQVAVTHKVKGNVTWSMGEMEFEVHGGHRKLDGERTVVRIPSIMALKNEHFCTRTPVLNNTNLFRRDLNICAYCGDTFIYEKLSRDHIIPVSRGGKDTWKNCVTSCKHCNNEKDNMTIDEWSHWSEKRGFGKRELLYVPYVPDRTEQLILQNRNVLADQMEFLKAFIPEHSRIHKMVN